MTYQEAIETRVSATCAVKELKTHGFNAWTADGAIWAREWCGANTELVVRIGPSGDVPGAEILAWLGY